MLLSDFLRERRLRAVRPYLRGDILDIGCGDGCLLPLLKAQQGYVGIERSSDSVEWLRQKYPERTFEVCDLNSQPLCLWRTFDTIVMVAVIEHLANPMHVLSQLPRYLKPSGYLVMTTPSPLGDQIHRLGVPLGLFSRAAREEHNVIFTCDLLTSALDCAGLRLLYYQRFLLGGNQLFVSAQAR